MTDILTWENVGVALFSIIIGGSPGYFLVGPSKMNRKQVIDMIDNRTPAIIEKHVSELYSTVNVIDKNVAVVIENLKHVSKSVSKMEEKLS